MVKNQTKKESRVVIITDQESTLAQIQRYITNVNEVEIQLKALGSENATIGVSDLDEVCILDDDLKHSEALTLVGELRERFPTLALLMLTRKSHRQEAVEAMKQGVSDYIFKRDLNQELFERALSHCFERNVFQTDLEKRNSVIDALFDQSREPVFLVDYDSNVMLSNKPFQMMFEKGDSAQDNFQSFLQRDLGLKNLLELLEEREAQSISFSKQGSDAELHYELKVSRIESKLGFERILGIITDVTTEEEAQREKIKSKKLENTARMARILAHEIRNPLTNINLAAEVLDEAVSELDEMHAYVEIIKRNVGRVDELLRDLLESVKPFQVVKKSTDLKSFTENVITQMSDRSELVGAHIQQDLKHAPIHWSMDETKMELALLNLMKNAFDAMENTKAPKLIYRIGKADEGTLRIEIQDNGKGMNKETSEHIFDAFYTAKTGGIGLGMTMVKNIVNAHKGKITIHSELGRGTRFAIDLPKN